MPVARKYGGRQVGTAALPGARRTAAETAESQGAGLALARGEKWGQIGRIGDRALAVGASMFTRIQEEERQRADEVALLEASNRLDAWQNTRLYDPETGALNRKGKDALELPEQVLGEFDQLAGEVEQGLGTDRQKAAFARLRAQRGSALDLTLRRHTFDQMRAYESGELKSYISNQQQAAMQLALEPKRAAEHLGEAVQAIRRHGPRLGLGPEQIEDQVREVTSATHVGILETLLAKELDQAAGVYLEANRGEIKGEQLDALEKAINAGSAKRRAQTAFDRIEAEGGTLSEKRQKAKTIEDADERDQVLAYIEHEEAVREREGREQEREVMRRGYDVLDAGKGIAGIPAADWASYDGSTRSAMRSYARQKAEGVPIKTDDPHYYALMREAAENPKEFAKRNLLASRAKLDDGDWKQLVTLQASIEKGDRVEADKVLDDYRTERDVIVGTLTAHGIDPTPSLEDDPEQAAAVANFQRLVAERAGALHRLTGKKPTNDEIQAIADDLISQQVTTPGSWSGLNPFSSSPFFDRSKRLIDTEIGDVPADRRRQIEARLKAAGMAVTDQNIVRIYIDTMARIPKR